MIIIDNGLTIRDCNILQNCVGPTNIGVIMSDVRKGICSSEKLCYKTMKCDVEKINSCCTLGKCANSKKRPAGHSKA